MKIVAISDLHGELPSVPEGDVLVLAGDVFTGDDEHSLRKNLAWVSALPHLWKIYVPGNHDLALSHLLKSNPEKAQNLLRGAGVTLLQSESFDAGEFHFHGIGWHEKVSIPNGVDILVTHEPAHGILDGLIGSEELRREISKSVPKIHICGHVHEYGGNSVCVDGTAHYNVAGKAVVIELN
jgi:Icc-related predicted phosphoesterase